MLVASIKPIRNDITHIKYKRHTKVLIKLKIKYRALQTV